MVTAALVTALVVTIVLGIRSVLRLQDAEIRQSKWEGNE